MVSYYLHPYLHGSNLHLLNETWPLTLLLSVYILPWLFWHPQGCAISCGLGNKFAHVLSTWASWSRGLVMASAAGASVQCYPCMRWTPWAQSDSVTCGWGWWGEKDGVSLRPCWHCFVVQKQSSRTVLASISWTLCLHLLSSKPVPPVWPERGGCVLSCPFYVFSLSLLFSLDTSASEQKKTNFQQISSQLL